MQYSPSRLSRLMIVAPLVLIGLYALSGCATPIADSYKESRIATPPHVIIQNSIASAEMIVLNPLLYYPLELVGIADFDLIWRDDDAGSEMELLDPGEPSLEEFPSFDEIVEDAMSEDFCDDMEETELPANSETEKSSPGSDNPN